MDFIPCRDMPLPEEHVIPAARTAIGINPANRPVLMPRTEDDDSPPPSLFRLALQTSKYWGTGGVLLTVGFMDNPPADLQRKILEHMNAWGAYANVVFKPTLFSPQVRIARQPDGYWSYIGTDVLHIPANRQTLNLQGFTMQTPDSEFVRVVRHETGHTLGFQHEHMRREIVSRLDPQKTVAYFRMTQGWSAQDVQQQVLTPLDEASLTATAHADQTSIMCYQLPGSITYDGQPIPGGIDIDEQDKKLVADLYPKTIVQPPPPPVNPVSLSGGTYVLPPGCKLIVPQAS